MELIDSMGDYDEDAGEVITDAAKQMLVLTFMRGYTIRMASDQPIEAELSLGELLRPREVAIMLGVSRSWLYQAAKDGRVPRVRLGGSDGPLRFLARDLSEWLERARAGWSPGSSTPRRFDGPQPPSRRIRGSAEADGPRP
jgi:excisionase family DNA binding protein